jgi:hypothetical protein
MAQTDPGPPSALAREERAGGPLEMLADYLARRRATRLVVDGLVVHVLCAIVGHVWAAFMAERAGREVPMSASAYVVSPGALFQMAYGLLFYVAWALVAVGCARLIADAARGKAEQ